MSGIAEQILSELQAIKGVLSAIQGQSPIPVGGEAARENRATNGSGGNSGLIDPLAANPAQQQQLDPLGMNPAQQQQPITEAAIMALIEPYLDNMALKTQMQGVLQSMGIPRLPEARPDQYPELYNRLNTIVQQAGGATGSQSIM